MNNTVTILCGLPGAGKSHYINDTLFGVHPNIAEAMMKTVKVISPDALLYKNGNYMWTYDRCRYAWAASYKKYEDALVYRIPRIYWDATFIHDKAREPVIEMAKDHGYKVVCMVFDTPFSLCVSRNNLRSADRRVPASTMCKMKVQWETDQPSLDEGIDRVEYVHGERAHLQPQHVLDGGDS